MFIDETKIYIKSGKGGDGHVSFRHEKFIEKGGPDGGDGGNGGDVIFIAKNGISDLSEFNLHKKFIAESGENGNKKKMKGKNAPDLILYVPLGTQIYEDSTLVVDLTSNEQSFVVAEGGRGGWGNQHFATSIKQSPKWSKMGLPGQEKKLRLELKTIADVGLVGLPNAGKSTLLSVVSNARPKIADYPFTTLEPNLGVIKLSDKNIIVADIPGLIEGAHHGRGLGDKFLRHIERTKIILHLVDASSEDPISDYKKIRNELKSYSLVLAKKKEIIVLNKIDIISPEQIQKIEQNFKKIKKTPQKISSATSSGIDQLINILKKSL